MEKSKIVSLKKLKDLDKKILKNLIIDSNQSFNQIAEKLNTTRQHISQRIRKLRENNIIENFSIRINTSIIEELQVKAYILFREDPNPKIRKIDEKKLKNIPQISVIYRLFGKYDGIIKIYTSNLNELTEIVNRIHDIDGIKETETFIIYDRVKESEMGPILSLLE
ncbi:MAG: Lrp/AsnC family transcriptional regulator, partial [Candidatus Helarchaeota archaeon]